MASTSTTQILSPQEGYRRWARSYDTELNPMLSVEKRYLEPMLPLAAGLDVVDLGCGTGRWLQFLRSAAPRSLLGIDSSPDMLRHAKRKLNGTAKLVHADGSTVSLAPASADLVLGSFLLSYVEDAQRLLANARVALRENAPLFLTDVHPETILTLGWKRGVRDESGFQTIRTVERSIDSVISLCDEAGLRLAARLEPDFGEAERAMFAAAGKAAEFERAVGYPAIYILEFRPKSTIRIESATAERESAISSICNAHIAIGPQERVSGTLSISNSRIESIGGREGTANVSIESNSAMDLQDFLLLPGLVNAHDHLEFALFPRLGAGEYRNSVEWAEDIHRRESAVIAMHRQVPKEVRLWWGGIRNLLCGATTVSHHNPLWPELRREDFPVRVVQEYGWGHSLALGGDLRVARSATPEGHAFIVHACEGVDEKALEELWGLERLGLLDASAVLVHGLAIDHEGVALMRERRTSLIACPSSNNFLFGKLPDMSLLCKIDNV